MQQAITDALDNFSQSALCQWLNQPGVATAVSALGIGAIATPDPFTTGAGLGLLATQMGCGFNPEPDPGGPGWEGQWVDACDCADRDGYNNIYRYVAQGGVTDWYFWETANVSAFELTFEPIDPQTWLIRYKFRYCGSTNSGWDGEVTGGSNLPYVQFRQERALSDPCIKPPITPPPGPAPEPITGPSTELGCTLQADLGGWIVGKNGQVNPVIKYKSLGDSTRASGGIISGCNWYGDLVYVGGGGGQPPIVTPLPPDAPFPIEGPSVPPWLENVLTSVAGEILGDVIDKLLEQPFPGITYQMESACDYDESGNKLVWQQEIPEAKGLNAIGLRVTALHNQLNQHLLWKTPICNEQPEIEGDFRTISFRSESTSPYGNSRLRKRFRYRSSSGLGLGEIVDHWKNFSWESGPYRVRHIGSSWGSLEVWAATEDEGKRVIRHAAREAGIDPDQVGRWSTRRSNSSRLGVSDTMKVDKTGGYYWITSRDGSDNRPVVAKTSD